MKAAFIEQTGAPSCIQYGDLPVPEPTGNQVLVRVKAASVNPIDTYIRNGADYWELPQPFIVGCDLAGEVAAVGPDATLYKPGDRVWGSNQGLVGRQGTFAEYCAVDECWLYPTPDNVDDSTVAATALVGITAHLGLFGEGQLQAGQSVFVRGGTGGVGSMVLQMARIAGARVLATAGSDEKVEQCVTLGADAAVNYKTRNISTAVNYFAPAGVDLFWETLREPNFDEIIEYLAEGGRVILMAGRDARPPMPVGPFYVKCCSMHGFVMFKASPQRQHECADQINQWLAEGKLKANISQVFPLSEAAQAHQLQEDNTLSQTGTLAGKIVVVP